MAPFRMRAYLVASGPEEYAVYRDAWQRGRAGGKLSLRRLQWQHAQGEGSSAVQMTIHLSKHWLGESEKALSERGGGMDAEVIQGDVPVVRLDDRSPEQLRTTFVEKLLTMLLFSGLKRM